MSSVVYCCFKENHFGLLVQYYDQMADRRVGRFQHFDSKLPIMSSYCFSPATDMRSQDSIHS